MAVATFRLRVRLAVEVRSDVDLDAGPSERWRSRCVQQRIRVNPEHDNFPAMLAVALDTLAACDWDVTTAAQKLGCSASQLGKFLQLETPAFTVLNQQRLSRGLHVLKPR
jgi:AraC-like DNA-binding protein